MEKKIYETIIIGAGMGGLTAAIYAARKRMNFLIIAKEFGGQMNISGEVLNYPGIVKTTGSELRSIMQKQMEFNQFEVNEGEEVVKVEKKGDIFNVNTDKDKYQAETLIVASGSSPKKLKVTGEEKYANRGVHYCAICDGPLYKNRNVAIIGGGNSALEAADFMLKIANKIYLIDIAEKLKAHEYLIERIKNKKNVEVINSAKITEIFGEKFVEGIKYIKNEEEKELKVDAVFVEIGRIPNIDYIKDLVELDEDNHIKIDCQTKTSIPGVFAVGDVSDVHEYQYIISAGQGCLALLKAAKYLTEKN